MISMRWKNIVEPRGRGGKVTTESGGGWGACSPPAFSSRGRAIEESSPPPPPSLTWAGHFLAHIPHTCACSMLPWFISHTRTCPQPKRKEKRDGKDGSLNEMSPSPPPTIPHHPKPPYPVSIPSAKAAAAHAPIPHLYTLSHGCFSGCPNYYMRVWSAQLSPDRPGGGISLLAPRFFCTR